MNLQKVLRVLYFFGFESSDVDNLSVKDNKFHFTTDRKGPFLSDTRVDGQQWICDAASKGGRRRLTISA